MTIQTGTSEQPAVIALAAGHGHCLALRSDGRVIAWGDNDYGQLDVPRDLRDVTAIAAGAHHSLALHGDGTVSAWGRWADGCTDVPTELRDVVAIDAGQDTSLALCRDGSLFEWGHSYPEERTIPTRMTGVTAIAADGSRVAVVGGKELIAWGGRLRDVEPPADTKNIVAVAAGYSHGLALTADGTVLGWGLRDEDTSPGLMRNDRGQADVPRDLRDVIAVAAAGWHSLALKRDGHVVAWGAETGQHLDLPASVVEGGVIAVAAGYGCSMAAKRDGTVIVWGPASKGQREVPDLTAPIGEDFPRPIVAKMHPSTLPPIVESMSGKLSFLIGPVGPERHLMTEGRSEPFPDEGSIRIALRGARAVSAGMNRYAHGRVASNLAAVLICHDRLQEALEAIQESERVLVDMVNDPMTAGLEDLPLAGLAAVRYNAALVFYRAGDIGQNSEHARTNQSNATGALAAMRRRDQKWKFVEAALEALP